MQTSPIMNYCRIRKRFLYSWKPLFKSRLFNFQFQYKLTSIFIEVLYYINCLNSFSSLLYPPNKNTAPAHKIFIFVNHFDTIQLIFLIICLSTCPQKKIKRLFFFVTSGNILWICLNIKKHVNLEFNFIRMFFYQ